METSRRELWKPFPIYTMNFISVFTNGNNSDHDRSDVGELYGKRKLMKNCFFTSKLSLDGEEFTFVTPMNSIRGPWLHYGS